MEQMVPLIAVIITMATLTSASIHDWIRREIPDWHWIVLFNLATIVSIYVTVVTGSGFVGALMPICISIITFDCLHNHDSPLIVDIVTYVAIGVTAIIPAVFLDWGVASRFISIPIAYAIVKLMYCTGLVKGGADAKALVCIAAVFPMYPQMFGLPLLDIPDGLLPLFIVPAFAVFAMALVLTLTYSVYNLLRNLATGNVVFPQMFFGTTMSLEKARSSKVWPMEHLVDGDLVTLTYPNEDEDAWETIAAAGREEVWVTAIIPFLIPITVAFAIMVVVGFPPFTL